MKKINISEILEHLAAAAASDALANDAGDEWLTVKEACQLAKVSRWTIRRWIVAGSVRAIKLGKARTSRVRIDVASLRAHMERMLIKPEEA